MLTAPAAAHDRFRADVHATVWRRGDLLRTGLTDAQVRAGLAAGRWQRVGRAIVLHNGELTRHERQRAALLNCGPRATLASFTAAEIAGLTGWERDEVHVLAPAGVARPHLPGLPVVLHRTYAPIVATGAGTRQQLAPALVLAAASFRSPRPACGILAAGVQQRLVTAPDLDAALGDAPRTRHRHALTLAVADIGMGAQALSEIDFVRLCRRHGLPAPILQAVRVEPSGRRRYLDAEWRRRDGMRVVAEIDGALHLAPRRWYDDQLRQNEVVIGGALVLRYPTVVVRDEEAIVADQLRRALWL